MDGALTAVFGIIKRIKRIKFLGIPVHDQGRALSFYTEKLGFQIFTDQQFNEKQRWIELKIPGSDTGIVLFTPDGQEDRIGTFVNTAWEVDNIEKNTSGAICTRCGIYRAATKAQRPLRRGSNVRKNSLIPLAGASPFCASSSNATLGLIRHHEGFGGEFHLFLDKVTTQNIM